MRGWTLQRGIQKVGGADCGDGGLEISRSDLVSHGGGQRGHVYGGLEGAREYDKEHRAHEQCH